MPVSMTALDEQLEHQYRVVWHSDQAGERESYGDALQGGLSRIAKVFPMTGWWPFWRAPPAFSRKKPNSRSHTTRLRRRRRRSRIISCRQNSYPSPAVSCT